MHLEHLEIIELIQFIFAHLKLFGVLGDSIAQSSQFGGQSLLLLLHFID